MVDQLGIHNEENNVSYILYYTQKYFHMDYRSKCDRQKNTRLEENLGASFLLTSLISRGKMYLFWSIFYEVSIQ